MKKDFKKFLLSFFPVGMPSGKATLKNLLKKTGNSTLNV
tara:strand:- start:555 stop:671 length:117 start_codon:yes stop_codon:yes gene_type:complete